MTYADLTNVNTFHFTSIIIFITIVSLKYLEAVTFTVADTTFPKFCFSFEAQFYIAKKRCYLFCMNFPSCKVELPNLIITQVLFLGTI